MIYITGDTHGERERFAPHRLPGEENWTCEDILIICGDFGYIFFDTEEERRFLEQLGRKRYTICFCDGNHENFPAIYRYPREEWNGGQVHRICPNVLHLMRGQVYELQGCRFFVMGGAYSIDKYRRVEGFSWWPQELPEEEEYAEAERNLQRTGYQVDYVITHTAPPDVIRLMGFYPDSHDKKLVDFLGRVSDRLVFRRWFFGHWHLDCSITERYRALLYDVVTIENG